MFVVPLLMEERTSMTFNLLKSHEVVYQSQSFIRISLDIVQSLSLCRTSYPGRAFVGDDSCLLPPKY